MDAPPAIAIRELSHHYGERRALNQLSLQIAQGEAFVFLGPNGGGKTTLFRILSTLNPPQTGQVSVFGCDLAREPSAVRARLGVVFQSPSLDKKLTVRENLRCQAALYGLGGKVLRDREEDLLSRFGLADRAGDLAEKLSGGLRRRVEVAKALLHRPQLLLLDEPSTGLDPGARSDLARFLDSLRKEQGVTIVLTTHLLDEADRADRIAILSGGVLLAVDSPERLRASVGGDAITIECSEPENLGREIAQRFQLATSVVDGQVRLELPEGHQWIARLMEAFPGRIAAIKLGKPTLEDVFIAKTGHRFWHAEEPA